MFKRGKFSFLYVNIWFDVTKCKFILKNSNLQILIVFSLIFVVNTKMIYVYNFVCSLNTCYFTKCFLLFSLKQEDGHEPYDMSHSLHETLKFHGIFCCGNFVTIHSFRRSCIARKVVFQIKSYFKSAFSCIRTRNKYAFSYFSCSARATYPKLSRHCAFPQNFHVIKSGEISVFYVVIFKLAKAFTYNKEFNTSRVKEVITFLWNR